MSFVSITQRTPTVMEIGVINVRNVEKSNDY